MMKERASANRGKQTRSNDRNITRRDFVGGTMLGAGAVLLDMAAPGVLRASETAKRPAHSLLGPDWTGPGGIGDYAKSNGNTHEVVNAAHSVYRGAWKTPPPGVTDAGEFDLVVVGGGFSGLMAAHTFQRDGQGSCLLLDNHPMFGGEAKQNELTVDGHHLHAPQGSNGFTWLPYHSAWQEFGLPKNFDELQWQRKATGTDKPLRIPDDSYSSMGANMEEADTGFFYRDPSSPNGHRWVKDPWANGFRDAPIPELAKRELMTMQHFEYRDPLPDDWKRWMDSMTYKEFLQKYVGVTRPEVYDYLDPMMASTFPGLGSDVTSAYMGMVFAGASAVGKASGDPEWGDWPQNDSIYVSFPGGNAGIARHIVKTMLPDAIEGKHNLNDVIYGRVNLNALDRKGQKVRMRLGSTVVRVEHAGSPSSSSEVYVTYVRDGRPYRVKAKGVVMASGQWINKHVVQDEPESLTNAMNEFHHAPMLTLNVAVRHWRFMEKLGISCARWFDREGFGWYTGLRAPMVINGKHMPLDPAKPTILTFYIPFTSAVSQSGLPLEQQSLVARNALFSMSYADIEGKIREQLTAMFGDYGFDSNRDIAGIISNRWGHAYVVPQPGFYFGRDGNPAPRDVVREGYGRVRFGHSELSGFQLWTTGCEEGERATKQVLKFT
jgi:spermidine dehydrogenase